MLSIVLLEMDNVLLEMHNVLLEMHNDKILMKVVGVTVQKNIWKDGR